MPVRREPVHLTVCASRCARLKVRALRRRRPGGRQSARIETLRRHGHESEKHRNRSQRARMPAHSCPDPQQRPPLRCWSGQRGATRPTPLRFGEGAGSRANPSAPPAQFAASAATAHWWQNSDGAHTIWSGYWTWRAGRASTPFTGERAATDPSGSVSLGRVDDVESFAVRGRRKVARLVRFPAATPRFAEAHPIRREAVDRATTR